MKNLFILSITFLLAAAKLPANSLSVGDKMPDLAFTWIGDEAPASTAAFQGKVVVIEFWATWCSPCIQSMRHLKTLQDRFGEDLAIIAVSNEDIARISSFISNTDLPFLFARENEALRDYFPHRVIPHTVVLSPDQAVAAITRPEALTEEVIAKLLRGEPAQLTVKADRPWDINLDIFGLDSTARQSFQIQPTRPDAPTYSRTYNAGPFQDRRWSFINFEIPMLYREAFSTSVYRMSYPEPESPETYCVDLLVPEGKKGRLNDILRDSLAAYFGWEAVWQPRETEAWILSAQAEGITLPVALEPASHEAAGDHFKSAGATPAQFADYLESFGIAGMPVIDETGSDQLYRFDFSFELENPDTFFEALRRMGLTVKKEKRVVDMLVLSPPE